jgi:predicted nucleic acid-binding protein
MKYLVDASSVFVILRSLEEERALRLLSENCLLDLTKYEVGNALWKEHRLHRAIQQKEVEEFLDLFREVLSRTKILIVDPDDLSKVAGIAIDEMMSFYDASYIIAAKDRNLTLVSEDTQLTKVASKHVRTMSSKEIISAS